NPELVKVVERTGMLKCIEERYEVRGVFVTNATADPSAISYLKTQPHITLYDGQKLKDEFVTIDKTDPISSPITFDISGVPSLEYRIGTTLNMVIAPISATELVKMEGIANGDLFAWNVRQYLGKSTAVNKSVAESIRTAAEHKFFPAFHNGVTILCKRLKPSK